MATDLAPEGIQEWPGVEVRKFDITVDDFESASFDVVHCRSVLLHLDDPAAALVRMVRWLRPDGWLVVEDSDNTTMRTVDLEHPLAAAFGATVSVLLAAMAAAGVHTALGRRLPSMVDQLGLAEVGTAARLTIYRGGTVGGELWKANIGNILARGSGVSADSSALEATWRAFDDPRFLFWATLRVQCWGRMPAAGLFNTG